MSRFLSRIVAAARLDPTLYEEVEADQHGTAQAVVVVMLSSLAGGVVTVGLGISGGEGILVGTVGTLFGWVVLATTTYVVGGLLFPEPHTKTDVGELLRTLGFAQSPGLARVAGGLPVAGPLALSLIAVWMLIAMVIAVRQALDYTSTTRAVCVCLAGWIFSIVTYLVATRVAETWLTSLPRPALLIVSPW